MYFWNLIISLGFATGCLALNTPEQCQSHLDQCFDRSGPSSTEICGNQNTFANCLDDFATKCMDDGPKNYYIQGYTKTLRRCNVTQDIKPKIEECIFEKIFTNDTAKRVFAECDELSTVYMASLNSMKRYTFYRYNVNEPTFRASFCSDLNRMTACKYPLVGEVCDAEMRSVVEADSKLEKEAYMCSGARAGTSLMFVFILPLCRFLDIF